MYTEQGKAPSVVFKHTLEHFSVEELSDAMIVIGFYKMLSIYIQTFNLWIDTQEDWKLGQEVREKIASHKI